MEETQIREKIRNLLEMDYIGIEDYLVENYDNLIQFLEIRTAAKPEKQETLEETVIRLLHSLGAPAHIKGYKYVRDAIMIYCNQKDDEVFMFTKDVYPVIAKKYGATPSSVDRAIRHLITKIEMSSLSKYGYKTNHMTNYEFVATISEIVKQIDKDTQNQDVTQVKARVVFTVTEYAIEEKITYYLQKMAIPPNIKGFDYLKEAINKFVKNNTIYMKKELYPEVADIFNTTSTRVERNIRHAIEVGFSRADPSDIEEIFGNTFSANGGNPTNSEFIAMIADLVK